jgi:hypothetical protein
MLKFKEYLSEAYDEVLPIDSKWLLSNVESMNGELELLTAKPYQNAPIFLNQLRGFLERYGTSLPASATPQFLNLSAEIVYALGTSGYNLYVVYETKEDGFVDGYAQVVNDDDLNDLLSMNPNDILGDREEMELPSPIRRSKRDDDAGNTAEY